MSDQRDEGPEETPGSTGQQPGVTPEDDDDAPRARPEDLEIIDIDEVADPPIGGADLHEPRIVGDMVDDPEDLLRTIQEATGESVEVVSEEDVRGD